MVMFVCTYNTAGDRGAGERGRVVEKGFPAWVEPSPRMKFNGAGSVEITFSHRAFFCFCFLRDYSITVLVCVWWWWLIFTYLGVRLLMPTIRTR